MTVEKPAVYLVGKDDATQRMWYNHNFPIVTNLKDADIVCFLGGYDVHPAMYGEKLGPKMSHHGVSMSQDAIDESAWAKANPKAIKVGICRGGQFLNIKNGGKMFQHVTNHANGQHEIYDTLTGRKEPFRVSSSHHQMMKPHESGEVLAYAERVSDEYWGQNGKLELKPLDVEAEVVYYEKTKSLCFQPHPEWTTPGPDASQFYCRDYFLDIIDILR